MGVGVAELGHQHLLWTVSWVRGSGDGRILEEGASPRPPVMGYPLAEAPAPNLPSCLPPPQSTPMCQFLHHSLTSPLGDILDGTDWAGKE